MITSFHDYKKEELRQKKKIIIYRILILIGILLIWEALTRVNLLNPFIFSSPYRVFTTLYSMGSDGSIFYHVGITMLETFLGFVLGTGLGILVAIILWWLPSLSKILEPYLVILNSLPKTALAPILIVWFGNNMKSIIIMSILISVVITILNTQTGFGEVDKDKITLVESFGGGKFTVLRKVMLPANIPTIMNVLRVNIGLCLVGVIIGEFLVAEAGLGYLIVYGSQIFKMDWVMLSIILLGCIAAVLYQCIIYIEKKLLRHFQGS